MYIYINDYQDVINERHMIQLTKAHLSSSTTSHAAPSVDMFKVHQPRKRKAEFLKLIRNLHYSRTLMVVGGRQAGLSISETADLL